MSVVLSPTTLRAFAGLFAAIAVVLNAAAAGHVDPLQVGEAVFAFGAVLAIAKAAVSSHAAEPAPVAHDPAPVVVGQP